MVFDNLVKLIGSERREPSNAELAGELSGQEIMTVTVVLHRANKLPDLFHNVKTFFDRLTFGHHHGASPLSMQLMERFAHFHQLTVVNADLTKRRVILSGTVNQMTAAFGVQLASYRSRKTGKLFRGRTGSISIPSFLQDSVVAVLGLDNRPVAKPHIRARATGAAQATSYTPPSVAQLYNFPTGVTGAGQTIGIIELGGGYTAADLTTYFKSLNITEPNVTAVAVDGGANTPGGDADDEVLLDIEVAGSVAPGANIAVYFAPNTDQGFIDAITDAVHDTARTVSIISISWGGPEDSWTAQSQTALNAALMDAAALGVTVTVAAGDNGSSDGETDGKLHVDFPASSPYALACGGTTLQANGTTISSETVWNETANNEGATGGGVSTVFALPSYQTGVGVPANPNTSFVGRGVPDVAGDADPSTGYQVLVDGSNTVVGGTSAVAPLWAGLVALFNQQLGSNLGFLNPAIYALKETGFHDITSGSNDDSSLGFYSAAKGWDACTGLGSPNGAALLNALAPTVTTPPTSSVATSGKS
jgi:kumamolisin